MGYREAQATYQSFLKVATRRGQIGDVLLAFIK